MLGRCKYSQMDNISINTGPGAKLNFSQNHINKLKNFIEVDGTPFSTIKHSIQVSRDTILKAIERGWAQQRVYDRIKAFAELLPEPAITETA